MVLIHFWGIWGHLVALNQWYLVKTLICQKTGFLKKIIPAFPQTIWSKNQYFWEFSTHTCILECVVIRQFFSKTLAWVFFYCLFMYRNGTKNLKNLGQRFHEGKMVWNLPLFCHFCRFCKFLTNGQNGGLEPKQSQIGTPSFDLGKCRVKCYMPRAGHIM